MKDLILQALAQTNFQVTKQIPTTKNDTVEINIEDVNPVDLAKFMLKHNIPDTAIFSTNYSENYGHSFYPTLSYDRQIPTTDKDKAVFKKTRFNNAAFKFVFDLLTINGYKRVGFNSGLLKEFDGTTIYDMYTNNEVDRLVKYYSLSFVKIN